MTTLYELEATYHGAETGRNPFGSRCVYAETDEAATEFARFIFKYWSDSTVRVSRYTPVHIPAGYQQGQSLNGTATSVTITEWDQP